jgi:hypothetical protein
VPCRFGAAQILGACLVGTGAVIVAGGGFPAGASVDFGCAAMYGVSLALMAFSAILREKIFAQSAKVLGEPVDVVLINGLVSISQVSFLNSAVAWCLSHKAVQCMMPMM